MLTASVLFTVNPGVIFKQNKYYQFNTPTSFLSNSLEIGMQPTEKKQEDGA